MNSRQILKRIGLNLRKAREQSNLTQEGLAELAGIHWKTVGYIEGGKRDFGSATLARIVLILKIPFNHVLEGIELERSHPVEIITKATARKRLPRGKKSSTKAR